MFIPVQIAIIDNLQSHEMSITNPMSKIPISSTRKKCIFVHPSRPFQWTWTFYLRRSASIETRYHPRTPFKTYLEQFSADLLKHVAKITRFLSRFAANLLRTTSNMFWMEYVVELSFIWMLNVLNRIFMFIGVDGKDGQKGTFSVRRKSKFHPSDFEWTFKIFLWILNLSTKFRIIVMDTLETNSKTNLKAVLLAQTPLSKNINGTGSHTVQKTPRVVAVPLVRFSHHSEECVRNGGHVYVSHVLWPPHWSVSAVSGLTISHLPSSMGFHY